MLIESTQIFTVFAGIFVAGAVGLFLASRLYAESLRSVFGWAVFVPVVAGLAYFFIGQGYGMVEINGNAVNGVRYLDWLITTPTLMYLLTYAMFSKPSQRRQAFTRWSVLIVFVIILGFVAEILTGSLKIAAFMLSSALYGAVLYLVIDRLRAIRSAGISDQRRFLASLMAWIILILWTVYPLIWLAGPSGVAYLSLEAATISFGLLDVLTKFGFALILLQYLGMQAQQKNGRATAG